MIILGLTGSIGMGKSTAAAEFRRQGIPVHDSDAVVHRLLGPNGEAVAEIDAAFPGSARGGGIDRKVLGDRVFGDPVALRRLESILHPRVRMAEAVFLHRMARRRAALVVLDIPLLLETGAQRRCDAVAVVTAPARLQTRRVLARPGMTPEKLAAILAQQMPDRLKRRQADFLIPSGLGRAPTNRAIRRVIADLRGRVPFAWPPRPLIRRRGYKILKSRRYI